MSKIVIFALVSLLLLLPLHDVHVRSQLHAEANAGGLVDDLCQRWLGDSFANKFAPDMLDHRLGHRWIREQEVRLLAKFVDR